MVGMSIRKSIAQIPKLRHFSAHSKRNNKSLQNRNDLFSLSMKSRENSEERQEKDVTSSR